MNLKPLTGLRRFLDRRKKLTSLATYAVMTLVPRGANAILAIAYAAVMLPSALGIYGVCLAMQAVLSFLLDGGISQAIVRTYYDHHKNPDIARAYLARMVVTSRAVSLLASLFLIVIGYFAWQPAMANQVAFWPIFPLVLLAGYLERGGELLANIFRALERPKAFATGDAAQAIALIASAGVFVVVLKLGVLGAVLALISGSLVRTIVFSTLLRRSEGIKWSLQLATIRELREAVNFGMPIIFNQLSTWGRQMGQRVVLLHVVNAAEVGVFFLASSVSNLLLLTVQSVSSVFDPLYYRRRVDDASGFREKVQTFTKVYFAASAALVIPSMVFVNEIFHLVFKNKYPGVGPSAAVLLAASYARIQQPFMSKQLLFHKKTAWIPLATMGPSMVALVLTPFVAPVGGLIAVSWLVLASNIASLVALGFAVRRYEELDYPIATATALLVLVCAIAAWISVGAPSPPGVSEIWAKFSVAVVAIIWCSFTWIWRNRRFLSAISRN